MKRVKEICFDMDGTIADLYSVNGWLDDLHEENERPYLVAKPMVNMTELAIELNRLHDNGYTLKVITWLAKDSSKEYAMKITKAKLNWLNSHLSDVPFDEINIVDYGTPKQTIGKGILFDDNKQVRSEWIGKAYTEKHILDVLRRIN